MTTTNFVNGTVVLPAWLNDVDTTTYKASASIPSSINRTAISKFADIVSVVDYGADPTGVADSTTAITNALASFPNQGSPTWRPFKLVFPAGTYKITSTISFKNQQGSCIEGYGAVLQGNFDGTILAIGDTSGSNDVLFSQINGLSVVQLATTTNARAVVGRHLYSCSIRDGYFFGGQYPFDLDGNNNIIVGCTFRNGVIACAKAGNGSNNEENTFQTCGFENGSSYGLQLAGVSGAYGHTIVSGCYFENNTTGNIYIQNAMMYRIRDCYFNLQNNSAGVILDGTTGSSILGMSNEITNCRVAGGTTSVFIKELSSTSCSCGYSNNLLESGICDMYGQAFKSINQSRRSNKVYVLNSDSFTGATGTTPPTGWTISTPSPPTMATAASCSQYGSAAAVTITGAGYIYQTLICPANALLRVSCWAKTTGTDATMQLWNSGLGSQFSNATAAATTSSPTFLEFYVPSSSRSGSATTINILLRNIAGTGSASFSNIIIEDMTN